MDEPPKITARQMAIAGWVNYNGFIRALNRAARYGELPWHRYGCRWEAMIGSPEHRDLQTVIAPLLDRKPWRARS